MCKYKFSFYGDCHHNDVLPKLTLEMPSFFFLLLLYQNEIHLFENGIQEIKS